MTRQVTLCDCKDYWDRFIIIIGIILLLLFGATSPENKVAIQEASVCPVETSFEGPFALSWPHNNYSLLSSSVPHSSLTHSKTDRRIRNRHSWTQAITCIHFLQIKPMHLWSSNRRQGSLAFKHVTWPQSVTGYLRQGQTAQGNRHTDRWACPRKRGQRWEGILWSDWATSSLYWLDWASRQQAARGQ